MLDYEHDLDNRIAISMVNALADNLDLHALSIKILLITYMPKAPKRTTHQVAAMLGVSNPGVRKALKQLLERGLVGYEKNRIIPANIIRYLQVS